ncbi:protein FAM98B isoform X2 [Hyalella azteca]|uniref:Protein FAM98B isoform X2 n=1 Tax=Hyalella azteca TaxID=294128 RepID=A0A8B7NPA2_HYAAZ|nr:protein FAM98B isoform X2 [Hyalella azteca]
MDSEVLDVLEDLGYEEPLADNTALSKLIDGNDGGPKCPAFTKLVAWATGELRVLLQLEEHVNATAGPDDHASFCMEVSAFLKEMGCPHPALMEGSATDRLSNRKGRLLLLHFILIELMAARMTQAHSPQQGLKLKMTETSQAKDLKQLLVTLGFPKPPNNITPQQLFGKAHQKLTEVLKKAPPSLVGKPLFHETLSEKQWNMLQEIQDEMFQEYTMRRQMMIKRLDLTFQSFQWSDQGKSRENDLVEAFLSRRDRLQETPDVSLGHLLAAREDLAVLEKTSNASVRKNTSSALNKVLIGRVPDRGGRPDEQAAPPPEMPSWTQRQPGGGGGGGGAGGRGGRGGSRGGGGGGNFSSDRVQGGWNQGGGGGAGGFGSYSNRGGGSNGFSHGGGYDNRGYDNRGKGGYGDGGGYGGGGGGGYGGSGGGGYGGSSGGGGYGGGGGRGGRGRGRGRGQRY